MAKSASKTGINHAKAYAGHRSRKAPKCTTCARTQRRSTKRNGQGSRKRRAVWTPNAQPCQFC